MATTKCGHCGGFYFEMKEVEPYGAKYKQSFIQCKSCGVPVGVRGYYDAGNLMKQQEDKIEELSSKIDNIELLLRRIVRV